MPTRHVVLTNEHERLVRLLVSSGRYQNASDVVREGLRLIEQREGEIAAKPDVLRTAAGAGMAEMERGDFKEFTDTRSLKRYLDRLTDEALSGDTTHP